MKICFYNVTSSIKNGGIETFIRSLTNEFSKRGHDAYMLGGLDNDFDPPFKELTKTAPYINRRYIRGFGKRFGKMMERLSFARGAMKILKENPPDVVQIFKPYDFIPAWRIKKKFGSKIVFCSQGRDFFAGDKFFQKHIDAWVSCSGYNAGEAEEHFGIRPQVIFNGVDCQGFSPGPKDETLANQLNITEDQFVGITVGRLVGWKGHRYIIDAMAELKDPNIRWIFLGDGPEKQVLLKQADDLGLNNQVIFLGDVDHSDIAKYYRLAHVFCQPSVADETFGITIAEAMSTGLPSIGTRAGGIPEVIDKAGILVKPRSSSEIAASIKSIRENDPFAKEISTNVRERAVAHFDWRVIADQYYNLYQSLM